MKNFSNQYKKYFSKKTFLSLLNSLSSKNVFKRIIILSILILISSISFGNNNQSSLPLHTMEMIDSISKNKIKLTEIPEEFLNNKEFILNLILKEPKIYKELPEKFKLDRDIIKIAFSKDYISLEHIPESIKNDKTFILKLVRINPRLMDSSFRQKVKEMIIKKEIEFNGEDGFLNLIYFSEYAYDDGKALYLKLRNGNYTKIRRIEEESDTEFCQSPEFWGYFKDLGFYLVNINVVEGNDVYLISDLTGEKFHIHNSYPNISPDKKYLVYADGLNGFLDQFNGIEIFEISPHHIKSVYQKEFKYGEFYIFHSWKDNNSFLIKHDFDWETEGDDPQDKYMMVYKTNSSWDVKEFKK